MTSRGRRLREGATPSRIACYEPLTHRTTLPIILTSLRLEFVKCHCQWLTAELHAVLVYAYLPTRYCDRQQY